MNRAHTLDEVAAALLPKHWTDSVRWLQRRLRRGDITGFKLGHTWMMTDSDVEAMVAKYRNVPANDSKAAPQGLSFTSTSRRQLKRAS